jgi:hypothetical protein
VNWLYDLQKKLLTRAAEYRRMAADKKERGEKDERMEAMADAIEACCQELIRSAE